MAGQEQTIAPKERINISLKDAITAAPDVELPFAQIVIGDATGRPDDTPVGEREVVGIDDENFDTVLKSYAPSLDLLVDDRLGDDADSRRRVQLKFGRLEDFGPKAVAEQVPELRELLRLRDALVTLRGPLASEPSFRKYLQEVLGDPEKIERLVAELGLGGDGDASPAGAEEPSTSPDDS